MTEPAPIFVDFLDGLPMVVDDNPSGVGFCVGRVGERDAIIVHHSSSVQPGARPTQAMAIAALACARRAHG